MSVPVDPASAFGGILPHGTKLAEGSQSGFLESGKEVIPALKGRLYYAVDGDDIVAQPANSNDWKLCPGQENVHCSRSVRPNPLLVFNHLGTYFHTLTGSAPFPCPPPTVGDSKGT